MLKQESKKTTADGHDIAMSKVAEHSRARSLTRRIETNIVGA
jgi:hypothetical protein